MTIHSVNNYPARHLKRPVSCFLYSAILLAVLLKTGKGMAQNEDSKCGLFSKSNLVAWCIVPFDIKKRGPEERASMLNRLGITKLAYDWREEHIPHFDDELTALEKHHIQLQGFWYMSGFHPEKDKNLAIIVDLLKRHKIRTQLWCMFVPEGNFDSLSQEDKVRSIAIPIAYVASALDKIGCFLGLYNHGGWFGEPENQLAILEYLKRPNIGMIYNFSHAEKQINRFPDFFPKIMPWLYSLNITGMIAGNPAIVVPLGKGDLEEKMISLVMNSPYKGPIGIINEDFAPDAEAGLQLNLSGLKKILKELGDTSDLRSY